MSTFHITHIEPQHREWQAKKGPAAGQTFHSYTVTAKGPDGEEKTYEVTRKPTSGPPPLGAVEAEVQPSTGNFPPKLKLTPQGGSYGGSRRQDDRGPEWFAAKDKRIGRAGIVQAIVTGYPPAEPGLMDEAELSGWLDDVDAIADALIARLDQHAPSPNGADVGGSDRAVTTAPFVSAASPAPASPADVSATGFASPNQRQHFERQLKLTPATADTISQLVPYMESLPRQQVSAQMDLLVAEGSRLPTAKKLAQEAAEWAKGQSDIPADTRDLSESMAVGAAPESMTL